MTDRTAAQNQPGITRRAFSKPWRRQSAWRRCGALTGFPRSGRSGSRTLPLLQVGGSYSAIIDIARQATKDLGFKIEMQNAATDALVNRVATQPKSLDIADIEYWMMGKLLPRQVLQGIDLQRFKYWDKVVPIFTRGIPGRAARYRSKGSCRTRCNTSKSPTTALLQRANAVGYLDPDALQRRHLWDPPRPGQPTDYALARAVSSGVQGRRYSGRALDWHYGRCYGH